MGTSIEDIYQDIGTQALKSTEDRAGKLIIYAEVEDGVISSDIFYINDDGVVRYRFSPKSLQECIYSFWEQWSAQPGNREWRAMTYVIDGGKLRVDLTYPDQMNLEVDLAERRPAVVKKHFGDLRVDYSKPQ